MRERYNVFIPMRDGTRLCADIFMPDGKGKATMSTYSQSVDRVFEPARIRWLVL